MMPFLFLLKLLGHRSYLSFSVSPLPVSKRLYQVVSVNVQVFEHVIPFHANFSQMLIYSFFFSGHAIRAPDIISRPISHCTKDDCVMVYASTQFTKWYIKHNYPFHFESKNYIKHSPNVISYTLQLVPRINHFSNKDYKVRGGWPSSSFIASLHLYDHVFIDFIQLTIGCGPLYVLKQKS